MSRRFMVALAPTTSPENSGPNVVTRVGNEAHNTLQACQRMGARASFRDENKQDENDTHCLLTMPTSWAMGPCTTATRHAGCPLQQDSSHLLINTSIGEWGKRGEVHPHPQPTACFPLACMAVDLATYYLNYYMSFMLSFLKFCMSMCTLGSKSCSQKQGVPPMNKSSCAPSGTCYKLNHCPSFHAVKCFLLKSRPKKRDHAVAGGDAMIKNTFGTWQVFRPGATTHSVRLLLFLFSFFRDARSELRTAAAVVPLPQAVPMHLSRLDIELYSFGDAHLSAERFWPGNCLEVALRSLAGHFPECLQSYKLETLLHSQSQGCLDAHIHVIVSQTQQTRHLLQLRGSSEQYWDIVLCFSLELYSECLQPYKPRTQIDCRSQGFSGAKNLVIWSQTQQMRHLLQGFPKY